jgi:hypothetical protein
LYSLLNIIREIKGRRIIWPEHVTLWEERGFWWKKLKERKDSEDLGLDG